MERLDGVQNLLVSHSLITYPQQQHGLHTWGKIAIYLKHPGIMGMQWVYL
jgi:hypothetical protein